jgi:predicted metal-dependent phosphoesterase TrpH
MKADLHIHTEYSPCSRSKVKSVLAAAQRRGLNTIAITDHDTIKGGLMAKKINPYPDLKIIVGVEKLCEYGELLIYGVKKEVKGFGFVEILKQARKQKAKVFIAHPLDIIRIRTLWGNYSDDVLGSVDGIEVANGRSNFNWRAQDLYEEMPFLKGVAGSDGHYTSEIGNTYVEYEKDLWKEIFSRKAKYVCINTTSKKLKYFVKSGMLKIMKKMRDEVRRKRKKN